ncbi:MAG: sensor domain-containing diguanylate cyclase [Gammaproteobacteria bacterium]
MPTRSTITEGSRRVGDNDKELIELRWRLAALTEEARRNEDAWQRAHEREMSLLEAGSLGELLERLTNGLRTSYKLAATTLVLADPEHEIRHLLLAQGRHVEEYSNVLFVDSMHTLAPQLATARPWLGAFTRADHELLFPANVKLRTVALLPLLRERYPIGSINLGSDEPERFVPELATDFLRHLAGIAAYCLESAVNRSRLIRSGFTDALTGWHNRRYLLSRLHEELARCRRDRTSLTCLMIDVDHFKGINDRLGHLPGDDVLRQVAHRIEGEVRGSDVAARYGGEEFVILLPATGGDAGGLLAERIRRAVADKAFNVGGTDGEPLYVTVSIGVAEHPAAGDGDDLKVAGERLIARADLALYEAKAGGRNTVAHAA